jgi:hypothetical protein
MHDFRFEILKHDEPEMGCTHTVRMIELVIVPENDTWPCETVVDGNCIEQFTTDDPYGAVEAAREVQMYSIEERFAMYAERGW